MFILFFLILWNYFSEKTPMMTNIKASGTIELITHKNLFHYSYILIDILIIVIPNDMLLEL
jgi:hypothetical protein